jgi:hypothetical protein
MQHYMNTLAKASGVHWDNDNISEVDELVDAIIDAAKEEIEAEQEPNDLFEEHDHLKRMMAGMS